ncbi:MAG: hypothetical protein JWO71_1715 [Candidatus Acidoferrum typicum]|nr:hypothetical protein [Candidatus Acidoferrum typicum]
MTKQMSEDLETLLLTCVAIADEVKLVAQAWVAELKNALARLEESLLWD